MASAGGLSRRRVGASSTQADDEGDAWGLNENNNTSTSKHSSSPSLSASTSHAGSAFEGGSKIAYDPRDLLEQEDEDVRQGGKAPRLTIMEEVLLLGLKDKQVCICLPAVLSVRFAVPAPGRCASNASNSASTTPFAVRAASSPHNASCHYPGVSDNHTHHQFSPYAATALWRPAGPKCEGPPRGHLSLIRDCGVTSSHSYGDS